MNIISALQSQIARNKNELCILNDDIKLWRSLLPVQTRHFSQDLYKKVLQRDRQLLKKLVAIQKALKKQLALHIELTIHGKHIPYKRYLT